MSATGVPRLLKLRSKGNENSRRKWEVKIAVKLKFGVNVFGFEFSRGLRSQRFENSGFYNIFSQTGDDRVTLVHIADSRSFVSFLSRKQACCKRQNFTITPIFTDHFSGPNSAVAASSRSLEQKHPLTKVSLKVNVSPSRNFGHIPFNTVNLIHQPLVLALFEVHRKLTFRQTKLMGCKNCSNNASQ